MCHRRRLTRSKGLPLPPFFPSPKLLFGGVAFDDGDGNAGDGREGGDNCGDWEHAGRHAAARGHLQMDLTLSLLNRFGALPAEAFYHRLTKQRGRGG